MKITVDRFVSDNDSTLSRISIDGSHECFGLEDEFREKKTPAETRIPAGNYKIGVRDEGGFHNRYSRIFPEIHRGMLHILEVANFTWVLIHCGNTEEDTAGCLLIGASVNATEGDMSLGNSRAAYRRFYPKVIQAALEGSLEIEFIDSDH